MDSSSGVLARPSVVLATATGFTVLMMLIRCRWVFLVHFDRAAVETANDLVAGRDALVAALQWISDLGDRPAVWTAALIATCTLLAGERFRSALLVACATLGGWAWELSFKAAVGRMRPVVDAAVSSGSGEGFPSGHAIGSFDTYGALTLIFVQAGSSMRRRVAIGMVSALVLVIGLTRLALGVHFPSDVVAG
jgi:membrane-associated phospholipid phosphatase